MHNEFIQVMHTEDEKVPPAPRCGDNDQGIHVCSSVAGEDRDLQVCVCVLWLYIYIYILWCGNVLDVSDVSLP